MTLKAFTVYDSKAEAYLQPFFMQSKGQAIRAFQDLANDETHQFGKYPADFTLFEIGEYDDATALIKNHDHKINLGIALEHKRSYMDKPTSSPVQLLEPQLNN